MAAGDRAIAARGGQWRSGDWAWPFWPALPIYPYGQRRTLRRTLIPGNLWTFDQVQGILHVVVPVRMTLVKLDGGGLLAYAPVAPTPECLRLVRELEAEHGPVAHIILPTVTGIEHKVFVGPFARKFPQARVWVAPDQWSFPLNLPPRWLGLPGDRLAPLPDDPKATPLGEQFDWARLGPIALGLGPFEEIALFDRRSRSLLVTDTLVSVPDGPPEVVALDPYPLRFHARDWTGDRREDSPETRARGWQRIALFAFFFRPAAMTPVPLGEAARQASQAGDRSRRGYFGLYPFRWEGDGWRRSFAALRGGGRPFVAPILQTLILNRDPRAVLHWADRLASWDFQRVVPCHLSAPIEAEPETVRAAFRFLEPAEPAPPHPLPEAEFALLRELEASLVERGVLPPTPTAPFGTFS